MFEYVYQNLKDQIITGYFRYGDKLPSMSQLGELYHVGIRTVKDVMNQLKMEGYIRTEERKAAIVIYPQPKDRMEIELRSIYERRTCILEVNDTISLIMPYIFSFCIDTCGDNFINEWKNILHSTKKEGLAKCMHTNRVFMNNVLENSKNLLFRDLYTTLGLYVKISLCKNIEEIPGSIRSQSISNEMWFVEGILSKDSQKIRNRYEVMHQSVENAINHVVAKFANETTKITEDTSFVFSWKIQRGSEHFYIQIARDIIHKITIKVYKEGAYLPSELKLSQEYNVSVSTIRKAISMLTELGFVETYNAKGTKIIKQDEKIVIKSMKNKRYKRENLMYLSALQLMAIIIRPAALLSFPYIYQKDRKGVREQVDNCEALCFEQMVECVIDHQPLKPLKTILQEVSGLIVWGYYYGAVEKDISRDYIFTKISMSAYHNLMNGNDEQFANDLYDGYCHVLTFIRDYMVNCGLMEAKKLMTPAINW